MLDVATALDLLVPAAEYSGSLTGNDLNAYSHITWHDEREKPSWQAIQNRMNTPLPVPLIDKLANFMNAQSIEVQAQFAALRAAVKNELSEDRPLVAKAIIENTQVPEELAEAKVALLAMFDEE